VYEGVIGLLVEFTELLILLLDVCVTVLCGDIALLILFIIGDTALLISFITGEKNEPIELNKLKPPPPVVAFPEDC
jgi:hypothetical protein